MAIAAPATPIFRTNTQIRSIKMLTMQAMARKIRGRRESPMALRIPEPMLYTMEASAPAKYSRI